MQRWWVPALAIALALTLVAAERVQAEEPVEAEEPVDPVAPFRLKALDGSEFDSEVELEGRITLVTYWRPEQKQSVRCLKDLAGLREQYKEQGVRIVTFVSGEFDRTKVEAELRELELQFPVLLDPERSVYGDFKTIVSPTTWFIDADQVRRFKYPGCRRDFATVASSNIDFLLGRISDDERKDRLEKRKQRAPRSKGTLGGPMRYKLGKRFLEKGQRKAAKREFSNAWKMAPPLVAAGVDLGLMLLQDGENEEALAILERALELAPEDRRAMGGKGVALIRLGKTEEGAKLLEHALEQDLPEPLLYYEMGLVSESRGSISEAARYFRTGLERVVNKPASAE